MCFNKDRYSKEVIWAFASERAKRIGMGRKMTNILVCDDDKEIVEAIEIYLAQEGYHVVKAYDGEQAIRALKTNDIQLMIIDVMMPKLDGIHATLKIREYSSIPIIILSAKSEDADKILGLNIGADDYVTKPFNPLELVARVKSQLRRYTKLGNLNAENNAVFKVGGLVINDETKAVFKTHSLKGRIFQLILERTKMVPMSRPLPQILS